MTREMTCPGGHKLQVRPEHAGREVRCPICKLTMTVPDLWGGGATGSAGAGVAGGGGEIGIKPPAAEEPSARATFPPPNYSRLGTANMDEPSTQAKVVGYFAVVVGLVAVVLARGANSLDEQYIRRVEGLTAQSKADFEREWADKLVAAKDPVDKDKLGKQKSADEANLAKGEWRDNARKADDAKTRNQRWGYFYELGFLAGSLVLIVGLLILGLKGQGSERTISLIILAVIAYSLYVGGSAWGGGVHLDQLIRPGSGR